MSNLIKAFFLRAAGDLLWQTTLYIQRVQMLPKLVENMRIECSS